jgi:putative transposase
MFVEQGLLEALARGRRVSPPKNRLDPKHLGVSPYFAPRNAIAQALDMIYADTKQEIATKRPAFIRKWRLKCKAVADSLDEAGDKLFTFTHFPKSQWKSIRTSNAIERLHEEFKRRIKTQTVLPSAETAAMLFWALLASGQITMRKVDGWQSLAEKPSDQIIDLAA